MITIPDAMRRPAEVEREELRKQLAEALAEIERLKGRSNGMNPPACSEPDDRWPPQINACLREILRYRKQQIDPEGYRKELADAAKKSASKPIKGSAQGGRKD